MTNNCKPIDIFQELLEIHLDENLTINLKYVQFRTLLERLTKCLTEKETLQFSNLFSRLSFVCDKFKVSRNIHSFRITANKVLHDNIRPLNEEYQTHFKYLSEFISATTNFAVPEEVKNLYPTNEFRKVKSETTLTRLDKLRVEIIEKQGEYLICDTEENDGEDYIRVSINESDVNSVFKSVDEFWIGAQLYLVNIEIDDKDIYHPKFIILEPDYLVDISAIAECFQEHGASEYNYLKSKFLPLPNNKSILLGNFANLVIDELFSTSIGEVKFKDVFLKHFKSAPFEYTACKEIADKTTFSEYASLAEITFNNIKNVFFNDFPKPDYNITIENATLEPSFLNEIFGIQGRLDIYQQPINGTNAKIVELKSGSVPWPDDGLSVSPSHKSQLFQYYQIIAATENIAQHLVNRKIDGFIFYSKPKENNLRPQKPSLPEMQEIFELRNRLIISEFKQMENQVSTQKEVQNICPEFIVKKKKVARWIIPDLENFQASILNSDELSRNYFFSFVSFIAKEQYLAKLGNGQYESSNGLANLWLNSFNEKSEKFEILFDLEILDNKVDKDEKEIIFKRTNQANQFVNFRDGDICVLYPRANENDNVTSNQVFKCSIKSINKDRVTVSFRYKQRNTKYFQNYTTWALERDFMDTSFTAMYRNIYSFINASKDKRNLILTTEPPQNGRNYGFNKEYLSDEQNRVINNALTSKNYFLLNGPPGTGKTSIIVKELVRELYKNENCNILLLAYTNRAVDELCETVNNAIINFDDKNEGNVNYGRTDRNFVRIGGELSCSKEHQHNLLNYIIESEAKRLENIGEKFSRESINTVLAKQRVFISTVASISGKTDIFNLKKFDIVIVDEASQILEPQIVGILPKCSKFILIGDHKQLPAIVLQDPESSKTNNELLESIGLLNRKNSLFERLYTYCEKNKFDFAYDKLTYQGRMHREVALFSNHSFYQSDLKEAFDIPNLPIKIKEDLKRQIQPLSLSSPTKNDLTDLLARKRLVFFQSKADKQNHFGKSNIQEADLVVRIVQAIKKLYAFNSKPFSEKKTIGIITPFRNQIALIKQKLEEANIPNFEDITVDTVERYQGSQRDIIIFSFAINNPFQLNGIVNLNDDGTVDRKLNVALTRAKEQLILIGNDSFLSNNLVYYKLIEFVKSKGGYIWDSITDVLNDNLQFHYFDSDETIEGKIYTPDDAFASVYDELVINKLKNDPRTLQAMESTQNDWWQVLLGESNDFIRTNVIEFGRADFDFEQPSLFNQSFSKEDKVNLYCFYNMRKHYFSGVSIFDSYKEFFEIELKQISGRTTFFDFGCGPLTSGIAFNQTFKHNNEFSMKYVGIDISNAMRNKATEFSKSILFKKNTEFMFLNSLKRLEENTLEEWFRVSNLVVLNFSYLFANLNTEQINDLVNDVNELVKKYPFNKYVLIYQNPVHRHHNFTRFKNHLKGIDHSVVRKSETVSYKNSNQSWYDKSETFTYEILSN
jgi:DNA replication ATP-dependent helicase Dna2